MAKLTYNGVEYNVEQCAVYRNKEEEGQEQDYVAKFIFVDDLDDELVDALFSEEAGFILEVAGLRYVMGTRKITVVASDETPDYVMNEDVDTEMVQVALIAHKKNVEVEVA